MDGLSKDMHDLFVKRAYDLAGVVDQRVKVNLNGSIIPVWGFQEYVKLYLENEESKRQELPMIYEKADERWEVCCSLSDGEFQ